MKKIPDKFYTCINSYLHMDIGGVEINCPYWVNHIENGVVTERGFEEGKGDVHVIRNEIIRLTREYKKEKPQKSLDYEAITYLARQNRIGIDCSGFVFRIMEAVCKKDMELMFPLGIRKTNADMLTRNLFSQKIDSVKEVIVGDLIRISKGHHALMVISVEEKVIRYIHSSTKTKVCGVHLGEIVITDRNKGVENQLWKEKTSREENWIGKYFHGEEGDGIYRNKILRHALNQ